MSAANPTPADRERFALLIENWIDENYGGNVSEATRRSGISRASLNTYRDEGGMSWPREDHKNKLAKAMGITLAELNARIEGVDLKKDVPLDYLLEQIRLRSDTELLKIDRVILETRESRLKRRPS